MTPNQEEALYGFLDNVTEPFTLENVTVLVRMLDSKRSENLAAEIAALLDARSVAFRLNERQWLSRRGFFEKVPFVIKPTKLELLNGILIPGHRCVPFANMAVMPHEYQFFWKGKAVPWTTSEGDPEDFYPYYYIFGHEYAPQYVARDNPENEIAFNSDPYEDPPEVSIRTLDMRLIYREAGFVPGDCFVARSKDWKKGIFDLEKSDKNAWTQAELHAWLEAAERGFEDSFTRLGPGTCTEEQIAYAYWYGGKRMREIPSYSLEEFLFEKTDRIEKVDYGIESRYWFAGKDIPDDKGLSGLAVPPDRTPIEDMLLQANVPISEYVILSYVRDAMFRNDGNIENMLNRIVPPVIRLGKSERKMIVDYVNDVIDELDGRYSIFFDKSMGPIRKRASDLHTAVVELAVRLQRAEMDLSWLPRHIFIKLSQIQGHTASLLEDLDTDEEPPESELDAIDHSLDSMVETFGEIKEMIDEAMNNYRRSNLQLVKSGDNVRNEAWQTVQLSVGGTEIWRRALVPGSGTLKDLHKIIQIGLGWKGVSPYRFYIEGPGGMDRKIFNNTMKIKEICSQGVTELQYEYGTVWNVKVIFISPYQPETKETRRIIAGEGAAPPETICGPLRFRKLLAAMTGGSDAERNAALQELGADFDPFSFDLEKCNKNLKLVKND